MGRGDGQSKFTYARHRNPFHDQFNGEIYHGRAHNETVEPDVEDVSHESSSAQPKQALLALTLQLPLALPQTPSPSPT